MIVGIDLGTTNSLVAYIDDSTPRVVTDADGVAMVPSVVAFEGGRIIVGAEAKRDRVARADRTVTSIKRFMGRSLDEVRQAQKWIPFRLSGGAVIQIEVDGATYTPPAISAMILKALKERAEAALGVAVTQAVITVPAYFNDAQRQATKDAGRIAGLSVPRVVNEPTAAALAYGLQKKKEGTIAVYDLGGGTFDLSILRIKDGLFEVLATHGDTELGGDDFDRRIMAQMIDAISRQFGPDAVSDPALLQAMYAAAEAAKCRLSAEQSADLLISQGEIQYAGVITRSAFEASIADLIARTLDACRQACADASILPTAVDEVVLVGGSTRIPAVRQAVADFFKKRPHCDLNPDEVVALGAAVQADILSGGTTDLLLLDVTPLSLGIETMGGVVSLLIARNTTIPTQAKESFTTYADGQRSVSIHVVQGERELVKECRSLNHFHLTGIDPMPAGMARIEVTFLINADGILHVTAKELRSGKAQSVEVTPSYGLADHEVEAMIAASIEHAKADMTARLLIEARNEATTVLRHAEAGLVNGKDLLKVLEIEKIGQAIAALRTAMAGSEPHPIRERLGELDDATRHLAEMLMDRALQTSLQNRRVDAL